MGSLLAFSAYVWLLGNAPLSLTATYAYVNPVVAVVLGALILGEQITWPILLGGVVVVAGVSLVVSAERPRGAQRAARWLGHTGLASPMATASPSRYLAGSAVTASRGRYPASRGDDQASYRPSPVMPGPAGPRASAKPSIRP